MGEEGAATKPTPDRSRHRGKTTTRQVTESRPCVSHPNSFIKRLLWPHAKKRTLQPLRGRLDRRVRGSEGRRCGLVACHLRGGRARRPLTDVHACVCVLHVWCM